MRFKKKPIVIEATQWFKFNQDDTVFRYIGFGENKCKHCSKTWQEHGYLHTLEGGHIVCPGDWIITGIQGEHYPCKPDIFEKTYERMKV